MRRRGGGGGGGGIFLFNVLDGEVGRYIGREGGREWGGVGEMYGWYGNSMGREGEG